MSAPHHDFLIADIHKNWDKWDNSEEGTDKGDGQLLFDSRLYGGCYRCTHTKQGLQALDMDNDGYIEWNEFLVYIKWALHQYPDTKDTDTLLSIVFQRGLIPAMRDETLKEENTY